MFLTINLPTEDVLVGDGVVVDKFEDKCKIKYITCNFIVILSIIILYNNIPFLDILKLN